MPPSEEREVAREALRALSRQELKDAVKAAIKESLRDIVTEFGWWSLKGIGVLTLGVILWLALTMKGWKLTP